MAKLKGPLLSANAHGKIANTLAYSHRNLKNITRKYHYPKKETTLAQWTQRHIIGLLTAHWQVMTDGEKATFNTLGAAARPKISGFNYFIKIAQTDLKTYHGLLAYWPLNENTGNTSPDLSGQGNTLTLGPTYPTNCPSRTPSVNKCFGNALQFDGTDDRAPAAAEIIPGSSDFTIEGLVLCSGELAGNTDKYATAFGALDYVTGIRGIGLRLDLTTRDLRAVVGNGVSAIETVLITAITTTNKDKWYHVLLAHNKSENKTYPYVNGETLAVITRAHALTTKVFSVGRSPSLNLAESYWYGKVDEVRIYNRLISTAEAKKHYNLLRQGKKRQYKVIH